MRLSILCGIVFVSTVGGLELAALVPGIIRSPERVTVTQMAELCASERATLDATDRDIKNVYAMTLLVPRLHPDAPVAAANDKTAQANDAARAAYIEALAAYRKICP